MASQAPKCVGGSIRDQTIASSTTSKCLCSNSCGYVAEIIRRCPVKQVLFGSDGGFLPNLIELAIAKLRATDCSPAVLHRIFYDNPQALLPLPEPARLRL